MIAADAVGQPPTAPPAGLALGGLYAPPRNPVLVHVPPLTYLTRDGAGPAEGSLAWAEAADVVRAAAPADRADVPLEVLHHPDGHWTVMLAVHLGRPRHPGAAAARPAGGTPSGVGEVCRPEHWAVQLLHVGDASGATTAWRRLEGFMDDLGYLADGPRHEVLLDGPGGRRRILRRAVRPQRTG